MRLKLYLITLLVYTGLGSIWFILSGQKLSSLQFGNLLPGNLNYVLVGVLYLLAVAGICAFAGGPFFRQDSVTGAAAKAAFIGLIFSSGDIGADYFISHTQPFWLYLAQIAWSSLTMAVTVGIIVWVARKWKS